MQIPFVKYHGTGNDFILIDDRTRLFPEGGQIIKQLCDRHFGVGADGIILLRNHAEHDFEMIFNNPDGSPASFCGNGGRCIVAFAQSLEIIGMQTKFMAPDGIHNATILREEGHETLVRLEMCDAVIYESTDTYCYLNTGTYHYVEFVEDLNQIDIINKGRNIRMQDRFLPHGTNVNFVGLSPNGLMVRTYEKGVENETLSCGTGVTASAIAASLRQGGSDFLVNTPGGKLRVTFKHDAGRFFHIYLEGNATRVFEGQISI